jgi:hypothetical protein
MYSPYFITPKGSRLKAAVKFLHLPIRLPFVRSGNDMNLPHVICISKQTVDKLDLASMNLNFIIQQLELMWRKMQCTMSACYTTRPNPYLKSSTTWKCVPCIFIDIHNSHSSRNHIPFWVNPRGLCHFIPFHAHTHTHTNFHCHTKKSMFYYSVSEFDYTLLLQFTFAFVPSTFSTLWNTCMDMAGGFRKQSTHLHYLPTVSYASHSLSY